MKNKILINFFSSGLQAVAIQILGVIFFYFISLYLPKESFGIISWANAASMFLTTLLSCGMEQVVIRRVASSKTSNWAAAAFFFHALVGSVSMFVMLLLLSLGFKNESETYRLLPWFFLPQAILYIGVPLKQFLNAKERFTPYGVIAFVSNVAKIAAAYLLLIKHILTLNGIIYILVSCALFELIALFFYLKKRTDFNFSVRMVAYKKLLKESMPQYVAVLFDSSLSRMDWILLGVISTNVVMADYSFAYRAFEVAKLPLLIVAPLIMPKLARLMVNNRKLGENQQVQLNALFTIEMFFAVFIPLCLNILWAPMVTMLTKGKYGDSNAFQFLVLSLCIPLQFFMNLLWSLSFTAKKYKAVSVITIIAAVANVVLNLILIPAYKGNGAAIAFLITTILQCAIYYWVVRKDITAISLKPLIVFGVEAVIIYFVSTHFLHAFFTQLIAAILLYIIITFALRQINNRHLQILRLYFKK